MKHYRKAILFLSMFFCLNSIIVLAEEKSADEIARELANPNTTLGTLTFNFDYAGYKGDLAGADDQSSFTMMFQPSLPKKLGEGTNLFVRPAIPLIFNKDVPLTGGGFEGKGVDLGDIGFDVAVGKSYSSGLVLIGGLVGTLPTATDDAIGGTSGDWGLKQQPQLLKNGEFWVFFFRTSGMLQGMTIQQVLHPVNISTPLTSEMAGR